MRSTGKESIPVLPAEEFQTLLYSVGNHEGKTAVAGFLFSQPDMDFTAYELWKEVASRQGEKPGWVPRRPVLGKYCSQTFEPARLVVVDEYKQYKAKPLNLEQRLAFCGSIMGWSLDFPAISVQKILGLTQTVGRYYPPILRYEICQALTTSVGTETAYIDVRERVKTKTHRNTISGSIRALAGQGILQTHVFDATTDERLEILDPEFKVGLIPYDGLELATRSIYDAMRYFWDRGKRIISFQELSQQAIVMYPDVDPYDLRTKWNAAASVKALNFPGLRRVERAIQDPSKSTLVKLHPDHAEAVTELVKRLSAIQTNGKSTYKAWQKALQILDSKSTTAQVFAKAKRFSAYKAMVEEAGQTEPRILDMIRRLGAVSVKTVVEQLQEEQRPLTLPAVRAHLESLVENGQLESQEVQLTRKSRRKTRLYNIASRSQAADPDESPTARAEE